MFQTSLQLLIVVILLCLSCAEDELDLCEPQKAFRGSCYEFVAKELSFFDAQSWCEEHGGHLTFIPDEDTQMFLQKQVNSDIDIWLGVASSASANMLYPAATDGTLSWLDGSHLTYSNWASTPQPGAVCGHILKNSGFQWEVTVDCNKKLNFICQFDAARSIVCTGQNETLQCDSAQVLKIDAGFLGRKSIHYCQPWYSPPANPSQQDCGWVDVVDLLQDQCQGHQVCHVDDVLSSLSEPCPQMGSYLMVDYHCKDALTLDINNVAAVFTDTTISMKWLLHFADPACRLSTGDGHVFSWDGSDSSVQHKYMDSGTFVVSLECTRKDIHLAVEKMISILEPVTDISATRCYVGHQWFDANDCKVLFGEALSVQTEAKTGSNVSYRIQFGERNLTVSSVIRGNVSHNITMTSDNIKQLGPGCHLLTVHASNKVTFPEATTDLQVCVVEKVAGLQAHMLMKKGKCLDVGDVSVGVSLEQGAPALLLFSVTGYNVTFYKTIEMNTKKGVFHIELPIQGSGQVRLRATNHFSSMEVDVNTSGSGDSDTSVKAFDKTYKMKTKKEEKHLRVVRNPVTIEADPSPTVTNKFKSIHLSISDPSALSGSHKRHLWRCTNPCKCAGNFNKLTHTITEDCLPEPFEFFRYHFIVIENNVETETDSICITLTAHKLEHWITLTCTSGCDPVQTNRDATITMTCFPGCPTVVWSIEDPQDYTNWPTETRSCYRESEKRPLTQRQHGGTEYTVSQHKLSLAETQGQDVTVVVTTGINMPMFTTYTIKTSSSSSVVSPTPSTEGAAATTTAAAVGSTDAPVTPPTSTSASISPDGLSCSIVPSLGSVLHPFDISCSTNVPCSGCLYCFTTGDKHLRCSPNSEVTSVFLPVGDRGSDFNLLITATAKKNKFVLETTVTAQVLDSAETSESSVDVLRSSVENAVAQLKAEGLLSGETVGQIMASVANTLNSHTNDPHPAERQMLREEMLEILLSVVQDVPPTTPMEVEVVARCLTAVWAKDTDLSTSSQEMALSLFVNLSSSLLHMDLNKSKENFIETQIVANAIIEGVGNVLNYFSTKNTSDALLTVLRNTQSALLIFKTVNEAPTIIQHENIGVFVSRVTLGSVQKQPLHFPNCTCPSFSLPALSLSMFPPEETVDLRMVFLEENIFSWSENGNGNISGKIVDLSLTTANGSVIKMKNLMEDIEIFLPRPGGDLVNTSVLDLGNYSTMTVDIISSDSPLVLKMFPSEDPLPFRVYLGYLTYPTEDQHVAMTEMPQPGSTLANSSADEFRFRIEWFHEQRYTWIVDPKDLEGKTGVYYLVVRPMVGPGIKSINATLSVTSISAACKFWNESTQEWSVDGCKVGVDTTPLVTHCLCNHLTFFGSSFFVTPNLVDPSRSAQLFATFADNPVVVCFVVALIVVYLLVLMWARRKDNQDTAKLKVTVLEDNNPMDEYNYLLSVNTGLRRGASTSSQVTITLLGADDNSEPHHLMDKKKSLFERGSVNYFLLTTPFSLGDLLGIRLWHNNRGRHPAWFVGHVMVQDLQTHQKWHFLCNSWLAVDMGDCSLDKTFPVATEMDLKGFSNLFFMKTSKDLSDGHLWYSVVSRPAGSPFTSVQRVSCCFSLLLCTMLTSLMFYGIPADPSEQTMDLGHFEFTFQQFMIGVQSSFIMFPINLLIVSVFRNCRPWEMTCCKSKAKTSDALKRRTTKTPASQAVSSMNVDVALERITKDISRIALSLCKGIKSNNPATECEFGLENTDINAVLSMVEDFVRRKFNSSECAESKTLHPHDRLQPQIPESSQKDNKTKYLYRQLCHIHEELSLLDSSCPSAPQSYRWALQQVQGIKSFLQDQLHAANFEELGQEKPAPPGGSDDEERAKKGCCHGGLPWWFVFVGWFLVAATGAVTSYFTMLYGLKFGKERSISWLVSMVVSFFQSVLITQPIKVLCFAAFFALVIKKVDEDDFHNVAFSDSSPDEGRNQQRVAQHRSQYEPPLPADVERMRRNQMIEQKAVAFLREIFIYTGFMWMLLLVAYGQKDPNAFLLKQHIRASFDPAISQSMSLSDVFQWANTSLLSNLFGNYPGFITDGKSKLVGNARLRQLRIQQQSCQTAANLQQITPDCHAPYSWEGEDVNSYDTGWTQPTHNITAAAAVASPWTYQTQTQLRAYPVWGKMHLYRGGGFVAELGPDLNNASRTLDNLFRNKWLDLSTRALFAEFTVYNANVNLFCIVTLFFETSAIGAFQFHSELQSVRLYQSTGNLHLFVIAAEVIYLLFIIYYMYKQVRLMLQQRWTYFRSKWNLLELSIIILTWSAVAVFIKRTLLGNRDMTYYQNHRDQFASFSETASADSQLQYLIAFLVLLATIKLWHLLGINPKMNMLTATLQRAWEDLSGLILIIMIMFIAYSAVFNVMYGWQLFSYRTLSDALLTVISLQIGIFNYDEVFEYNPVIGGLLIGSCIMFMTFVVLNFLITGILVAFQQEQIEHEASEEREIIDLLQKKICGLFGIRSDEANKSESRETTLDNEERVLDTSEKKPCFTELTTDN